MCLREAIREATTRRQQQQQQVSYRLACVAPSKLVATGETNAAFVSCFVLASDADCERSLDEAFQLHVSSPHI